MNLKRIELKGFKSFADRTVIDFKEGVTCIVGPNGCGKSNITDAIRWVLGEQKTTSLRAKKMEDVIFNGTLHRNSQNYAEVNIVLENAQDYFESEGSELSLKRILHRSGESNYYINNKVVRLKDLREILMDSGIGISGYSLISQGDIEDILKDSKFNRRKIFEEASGISLFDFKKTEAERRLEKVQQHIARLQDIFQEVANRVEPLREASANAKLYLELQEKLKAAEIYFFFSDFERFKAEIDALSQDIHRLQRQAEQHQGRLQSLRDERSELEALLETENLEQEALRETQSHKLSLRDEANLNIRLQEEKIQQFKRQSLEVEQSARSRRNETEELAKELDHCLSIYRQREEALHSMRQELDALSQELEKSRQLLESRGLKRAQREQQIQEHSLALEASRSSQKLLSEQEVNLKESLDKLRREARNLKIEKRRREDDVEAMQEAMDELLERMVEEENLQLMNDTMLEGIGEEIVALQQEISWNIFEAQRLQGELKILEINDSQQDTPSPREHMERIFTNKVEGSLVEFISPKKGYEKAVEGALHGRFQHLLLRDISLSEIRQALEDQEFNLGLLLPASAHQHQDAPAPEGSLGALCDFVSIKNKQREPIKALLQGIHVVEEITEEGLLQAQGDLVSLSGDYYRHPGFLRLQAKQREDSFFARRERTFLQLNELEEKATAHQEQLDRLQEQQQDRRQQREDLAQELQKKQEKLQSMGADKHQKEQEKAVLLFQESQLKESLSTQENLLEELEKRIAKEHALEVEHLCKLEELREAPELDQGEEQEEDRYAEKLREQTDHRIRMARSEEEFHGISERRLQLERQQKRGVEALKELTDKGQEIQKDIEKSQAMVDSERERYSTLKSELLEFDRQLHQLQENMLGRRKQIKILEASLEEERLAQEQVMEKLRNKQIQHARVEERQENLRNDLWNKYEMSVFQAKSFLEAHPGQYQRKELREIQLEMMALEPVNLASIDEYDEVRARHEFLKEQLQDLHASQGDISQTIANLETTMKEEFTKTFQEIQKHFQQVFQELFQGGEGEISLEDEDNVLESDIRILASPPGKKLQYMNLLSGGEKALTAIALLFSVLRAKPAPFYVLDEIEAALDDFNIQRFGAFLTEFSRGSQFILITHRKGTMEYAQALYGVSMEEKGISKTISLNLERREHDQRSLQ